MDEMDLSEDFATLGDRIAKARDELDMSQENLAKRLGVKTETINKWENNQSEPRANRLYMMGGILNASVMWLLTGTGDAPSMHAETRDIDANDIRNVIAQLRQDMAKMQMTIETLESCL